MGRYFEGEPRRLQSISGVAGEDMTGRMAAPVLVSKLARKAESEEGIGQQQRVDNCDVTLGGGSRCRCAAGWLYVRLRSSG